ncbi:MAG: hypothetical protein JKY48_15865 [Flavobacteriales bacterium]|nr:hypothetical protein [Flavobacteriales bacterium]
MKKNLNLMLLIAGLFACIQSQAQTYLQVQNTTNCKYQIKLRIAKEATCLSPIQTTSLWVTEYYTGPAQDILGNPYVTLPGEWIVGVEFVDYGFGLSSPIPGPGPCPSFPSNANFPVAACLITANAQYIQAPLPFPLVTPSELKIW